MTRLLPACCWMSLCLLGCALVSPSVQAADPASLRLYIGTYTGPKSKGVYTSTLDLATGKLSTAELAVELKNPSFLAVHPQDPTLLYAVSEVDDAQGKPSGGVAALKRDPATNRLTVLNAELSGGAGPCHLNVDATGRHVLVANYGGGSVAALPIVAGGKLGPATSVIAHQGNSVNPQRQKEPHAHSINLDPANRFAFAADLGLDQVLVYAFDPQAGTLARHEPPFAKVTPGAGPRHFAFRPDGKFAYVINELGNTITVFEYASDKGVLKVVQDISTLPAGHTEPSYTAEVVVHPSGKFVYGSNRGHDSIAMFTVDPATGLLTAQGQEPTRGKAPRNFVVDPTGRWLLAENQGSDTIYVFAIDQATGRLKETGSPLSVPTPVCVRFVK
ncbi:MAG: lactonase family protein [Planctomycetaceae bacterium]